MRRAAVHNVLHELGLDLVPGHLWSFVQSKPDIGAGLDAFFTAVGSNPVLIRERDKEELTRTGLTFELLVEIDDAFARLAPEPLAKLAAELFSGDLSNLRRAAKAVRTFERIHKLGIRWPADRRLSVFDSFLEALADALADPLSVDDGDVEQARVVGDAISALMMRFDEACARFVQLEEQLASAWPEPWRTGMRATQLQSEMSAFENVALTLRTTETLDVKSTEVLLEELERILSQLKRLLAEARAHARGTGDGGRGAHAGAGAGARSGAGAGAGGGAGRRSDDPASTAPLTEREKALQFFSFGTGDDPAPSEIRARWRAFMLKHHPDHAIDAADSARRTMLAQDANYYYDLLRGAAATV
jgi:hypothetical protein